MTAEEIRAYSTERNNDTTDGRNLLWAMGEIAAQIAEHNERDRIIVNLLVNADARNEREAARNEEIRVLDKKRLEGEIRLIELKEQMWKPVKP